MSALCRNIEVVNLIERSSLKAIGSRAESLDTSFECMKLVCCIFYLSEILKSEITKPEIRARLRYISSDQFGMEEPKEEHEENIFLSAFRKLNFD